MLSSEAITSRKLVECIGVIALVRSKALETGTSSQGETNKLLGDILKAIAAIIARGEMTVNDDITPSHSMSLSLTTFSELISISGMSKGHHYGQTFTSNGRDDTRYRFRRRRFSQHRFPGLDRQCARF